MDRFYALIADYMRTQGYDVKSVVNYEEYNKTVGICETCRYTYHVLDITYVDSNDEYQSAEFQTTMKDLFK